MTPDDPLIRDVPPHLVDQALEHFGTIEAEPGEVLLDDGEQDRALLYLIEGAVSVERGGCVIDTSAAHEILGEMAMFRGTPRVARVVAREPTRALRLDVAGYDALRRLNNPVVFQLERLALRQLAQRLGRLDALVAERAVGMPDPYAPPPKSFFERLRQLVLGDRAVSELEPRTIDRAAALGESHLFRGEPWLMVKGLSDWFEPRAWRKGELLCEQGKPGDAVYVLVDGWADVVVNVELGSPPPHVHKMGTIGRGAAVGMTSLLDERPRMANVIATTQVDGLALGRDEFRTLVSENGQISSAFRRVMIRAFAEQVDEAGARLLEVAGDATSFVDAAVSLEVYAPS